MLLLACSSLAVAASILVDYNGALAMCVAAWLTWAFLRADRNPRYTPPAAVLLALTFGVGLGVGLAGLAGVLLWVVAFRRSAFIRHAATLLAGVAIFLIAFWLAAQLGRFPFSQPFLHNFQRAALHTPLGVRLAAVLHYVRWYLVEIGWIPVVAALFLGGWRLVRLRARPGDATTDGARALLLPSIVLVTLVSQAALSADAYGFPKYIAFAVPLLFAFLGGELACLIAGSRWRWPAAGLAALLVVSLGLQTAAMLRRPGGTLYMAGEQRFGAAAAAVAANTAPDEVVLSSKDVGFYAGRKFIQWTGNLLTNRALLEQRLAGEQVRLAAANQAQLGSAGPEVAEWLADQGAPIDAPGDWRLYRLR